MRLNALNGSLVAEELLMPCAPWQMGEPAPARRQSRSLSQSAVMSSKLIPTFLRFCWMYSFIGRGSIWPEPEGETSTFSVSGLSLVYPASARSFLAVSGSYLIWNFGEPNHGLDLSTAPAAGAAKPPSSLTMPSRSIARLTALRTRRSRHGESSLKLMKYGQMCG